MDIRVIKGRAIWAFNCTLMRLGIVNNTVIFDDMYELHRRLDEGL